MVFCRAQLKTLSHMYVVRITKLLLSMYVGDRGEGHRKGGKTETGMFKRLQGHIPAPEFPLSVGYPAALRAGPPHSTPPQTY